MDEVGYLGRTHDILFLHVGLISGKTEWLSSDKTDGSLAKAMVCL